LVCVLAGATTPAGIAAQRPAAPDTTWVTIIRSLAYRQNGDSTQQLLFYDAGRRSGAGVPTVVFVHGGGLTSGDRSDPPVGEMCPNFLRAGIACVSVNYRLVSRAPWPAQPDDVASAVAWVIGNVASMGGDPKRVFVFGHSSGCHLVSLIVTDTTYLTRYGRSPRDLAGVVAMGCLLRQVPPAISDSVKLREFFASGRWIYPSLETFRDADPTRHVGPHVPPTLVLVAEAEQLQPPILENARAFADRMREAGRPVDVEVLPNRTHMTALTMMQDPLDPTFMRIVGFIARRHR